MGLIRFAPDLDFDAIRAEFELTDEFPAAALAEAQASVDAHADTRVDRTDLPFVTIDPPTSMDLDQAVHLARTDTGFVLSYAIADVGAVVVPGGALDTEVRRRGQTVYLPDGSVPLHPRVLSEDAASLLPGRVRPAALWTIETDAQAIPTSFAVTRALVRSVARFDYAGVQADADRGALHTSIAALPDFGRLRAAAALDRGAIELRLPEQEVVAQDGRWRLDVHPRTEADDWNAQLSLLAGMCAAQLMLSTQVGVLRTMPWPDTDAVQRMRHIAAALRLPWPAAQGVGPWLAALDANAPTTMAMMTEATRLLRGADYVFFDGSLPELTTHGALAAPYAHVTAPLRRLGDRFTTEVCLAVSAGVPVPDWARAGLPDVPAIMRGSDSLSGKVERACIDLTEATLLADRVGERFPAVVTRAPEKKRPAEVFVASPPVLAKCTGATNEGQEIDAELVVADPVARKVEFATTASGS